MNLEPIGNLVGHVPQCDPAKLGRESIIYLDISSVDRETKQLIAPERIAVRSAPSRARQQVYADDVLISTVRPNLNAVALVPPQLDGEVASTGFCVLHPFKDRVCPQYLFYFTQTDRFVSRLTRISNGASYPAVTDDDVLETEIPLCRVSEQKRVAGVLEGADRLRRTRRYTLELSDTFLPAAFLELFGYPRKASTRWESDRLEDLGALDRGRSRNRPRNAPHLYGGPYPFVQTGDVANAEGYIRSHSQTYSEEGLKQSKIWPAGTLCITIAANIADTAILTYPACFPDSVVGFIPGPNVKVDFVRFWLQFLQETLQRTAPEVAQKNINLEILRELRCPVPPLPLQERFVALVARYERLRAVLWEALRQAEHLFQSLLHQAFAQG